MLAYTAGDALNAITREYGVASTRDWEELLDVALYRKAVAFVGRLFAAMRLS